MTTTASRRTTTRRSNAATAQEAEMDVMLEKSTNAFAAAIGLPNTELDGVNASIIGDSDTVIEVDDDWMAEVTSGITNEPPRLIIYGTEGVGKSTLAAAAPSPIFQQTEDGLGRINVSKFPLATDYDMVVRQLGNIINGRHKFQTYVMDSLDWLEKLIHAEICSRFKVENIVQADGGYGRGYGHAMDLWHEMMDGWTAVRDRGMAVILIAHAKVEKFNDPESTAYDRYTLRLHKDADSTIREWSDAVMFAKSRMKVVKEDAGFNKVRTVATAVGGKDGVDGGERVLRTVGSPACVAKNRYGMPFEMPLNWDEMAKHF